ncbi:OLC1v1012942C1 [Oldenlandia corymbosa var. corymbosa]|uniref:OLC1v1012942C1 n=1 Tax=Oldenlandia corymbosa var. corymbosa TaxID=529605 RepID=A0AAV1DX69_OLDCO|nr:OLC1v1012942C1 [Oldenlandia corymbosa var. corymbosa]
MSVTKQNQNQAAAARELKQKVLLCLHKLSDRDTHKAAAVELESIAKDLTPDTLPSYISSITATDSADKSTVRKQCLNLITILAVQHGNSLSPYISKLLSAVLRRLRDSDTSIRAACASAASAIAAHVTKPSFSTLTKPFIEALFTEQEQNSQIGTALCLSAVIEAVPEPDLAMLRKLLGRFEKLVKCDSFKAKAGVLGLIGSVIEVGAVGSANGNAARNLVTCLMELLSSEDWAARKGAAESLMKLALVEKESLRELKFGCLKTFEAKRFDKVKVVRETMNQMVEAWREIPDESDEPDISNLESQSSTKDVASEVRHTLAPKTSCTISSGAPQLKKKLFSSKSSLCNGSWVASGSKRNLVLGAEKKTGPAMFRKLDPKKPSDSKSKTFIPTDFGNEISEGNPTNKFEKSIEKGEERNKLSKAHNKRSLFIKSGFRVVPCEDEISDATVVVSNETSEIKNLKDSEDLSLIRKQLVQIENQQSNLLDLLQKFMGSSQSGMQSLETRVHGLELALDEISFDLAVSTGRMSTGASSGTTCCRLPGANFLSSKLWRKTQQKHSSSRLISSRGPTASNSIYNKANETGDPQPLKLESRRSRFQGGHGVIRNPLAKIPSELQDTDLRMDTGCFSKWVGFCNMQKSVHFERKSLKKRQKGYLKGELRNMGMQRESPKKVSPLKQKTLTLQHLFDLDSPRNCGLRDCSDSQTEEIFSLLAHCSVVYTFNDPEESTSQQDLKRVKLIRLLSLIKSLKVALKHHDLSSIFALLSANLFRPINPTSCSFIPILPDDEEPVDIPSASWSHLQIVFDILQLLLLKTDVKRLQVHIDHSFLISLLNLFRSEDPRERESLKNVYHQIYAKFTFYRSFMRKAMNDVFLHYIFEQDGQRHCGIGELLEIWGSIINGFTVPLKEEHKLFLMRVLIPLHKPKGMQVYHRQLTYCVIQFVQKEPVLGGIVVKGILRYWPVTNCQKEVLLIGELEDLVENLHPEKCKPIATPLCTQITRCMNSWNSQVAERALYVWNRERFVKMASQEEVYRLVVKSVEKNLKHHWSNVVRKLTENVKETLQESDPSLYSKCASQLELEESEAKHREMRKKKMWERIEMAAKSSNGNTHVPTDDIRPGGCGVQVLL